MEEEAIEAERLETALAGWRGALTESFVTVTSERLASAGRATFATTQRISVILEPSDRDQLRAVLRIANECRQPVYPVSGGKNWGYGSRVPASDGCALLDLHRMDRITGFDDDLGYVTVEPGVTQSKLYEYLREKGSKWWMDATGSSPEASVIGNTLERGFGHTPLGDHFSHVCGLEVLLPTGDTIRTGYGALSSAGARHVYKWGLGPSLDGLFSQSNFGVVTEMTVWLMPKPEYFQAFFFQADSETALGAIIDSLRRLRIDGTLRSAVHIGNDYKVLAGIQQFPWGEEIPLAPRRMAEIRKKLKFTRWSGSGALYGSTAQVAAGRHLVRAALRSHVDQLQFLDDRKLALAARFTIPYRWFTGIDLSRTLDLLMPVYGLLKGIPTWKTLGSAYWRKRMSVPADADPDRDGCGVIWLSPVARMEGCEASRLVNLAERSLLEHGFEPLISVTLLTERALACIISITYDRDIDGEDQRAMKCYRELRAELESQGYYSYRLGIAGMPMRGLEPAYESLLANLKNAIDPNAILSPQRYLPIVEGERSSD